MKSLEKETIFHIHFLLKKDRQSLKNTVKPVVVETQKAIFSKYLFLALPNFLIFSVKNDICGTILHTKCNVFEKSHFAYSTMLGLNVLYFSIPEREHRESHYILWLM